MKRILLAAFLLGLLVFRPTQALQSGMLYGGVGADDLCYLAHSTAVVYGNWPNYSKEAICNSSMPMASIGPGLLAAPFVAIASIIDRAQTKPITQAREEANTTNSATAWGFILATSFYFGLSLILLKRWLEGFHILPRLADWAIILMILCEGTLLFVFRRPVFSHIYELFTCIALLRFLQRRILCPNPEFTFTAAAWAGALAALVTLVRYDNLPLALAWPAVFLFLDREGKFHFHNRKLLELLTIFTVMALIVLFFKILPTLHSGGEKYASTVSELLKPYSASYLLLRLGHFIAGKDWGLVFSAPFLLCGLLSMLLIRFPHKALLVALALPLLLNFYIVLVFGSNGGWYGYRYFIFKAFPIFLVPFAELLRLSTKLGKKAAIIWFLVALSPTLSMILFEGNDTNLTLNPIQLDGRIDWGNLTYQYEVWKTVVDRPVEALFILFKGTPAYISYLLATTMGLTQHLPALVRSKFAEADWTLLLRCTLLFAFVAIGAYTPLWLRLPGFAKER